MILQAALKLTEAQQVDVMYLRQLFYARLGSLSRERKEALRQAPVGAIQATLNASTRVAAVGTLFKIMFGAVTVPYFRV